MLRYTKQPLGMICPNERYVHFCPNIPCIWQMIHFLPLTLEFKIIYRTVINRRLRGMITYINLKIRITITQASTDPNYIWHFCFGCCNALSSSRLWLFEMNLKCQQVRYITYAYARRIWIADIGIREVRCLHYIDAIMTTMASQITSLTVVYSTVYSDADQRKPQSTASLAFVSGIHRDRLIPRTKGQLRGKCFHLMTSSSWCVILR